MTLEKFKYTNSATVKIQLVFYQKKLAQGQAPSRVGGHFGSIEVLQSQYRKQGEHALRDYLNLKTNIQIEGTPQTNENNNEEPK